MTSLALYSLQNSNTSSFKNNVIFVPTSTSVAVIVAVGAVNFGDHDILFQETVPGISFKNNCEKVSKVNFWSFFAIF